MTETPKPVESVFCASLIVLLQLNKVYSQKIVDFGQQFAALRQTIKPLDPAFDDAYSRNLETERKKNLARVNETISELQSASDELLQSLRDIQKQYPAI